MATARHWEKKINFFFKKKNRCYNPAVSNHHIIHDAIIQSKETLIKVLCYHQFNVMVLGEPWKNAR